MSVNPGKGLDRNRNTVEGAETSRAVVIGEQWSNDGKTIAVIGIDYHNENQDQNGGQLIFSAVSNTAGNK